jgi:phospholipid-binding lipoprotein MlaA
MSYFMRSTIALATAMVMTGCATANSHDPFEGYNRAVFNFNDRLDQAVLEPTAQAYHDVTPDFLQIAIGNFFENIGDVWTAANNLLQGKVEDGLNDVMRVAVNTTLGWGGLIDIGSAAGIPKHKQDFGTTLGVWGVPSGPYVMLPLLGPSTIRDTAALPADYAGDAWSYVDPTGTRAAGSIVRLVDKRAAALDAFNLIEEAALDRYEFIRDAYLQRRENKINQSKEKDRNGDMDEQSMDRTEQPSSEPAHSNTSDVNVDILEPKQEGVVLLSNDFSDGTAQKTGAFMEASRFSIPVQFASIMTLPAQAENLSSN